MIDLAPFILAVIILVGMTAYFFIKADEAEEKEFENQSNTFNRYFDLFTRSKK